MEQHFPDWNERMDYKKKQEKFYKLAMKRKKELKKVKEMALQQKVYIQNIIQCSHSEEVEEANDIQSQTMFQDFIFKMNQYIEFIQSTLDWIDNY